MKFINRVMQISCATLGILIFSTTMTFATTGTITNDEVRLRKENSTSSEILTDLYKGYELEVIKKEEDWYNVKYKDFEGYVYGEYVKLSEELPENTEPINENEELPENTESVNENIIEETLPIEEDTLPKQMKTNKKINLYIMPNMSASVIETVETNVEIKVIKIVNDWSCIEYETKTCWVRNRFLSTIEDNTQKEETKPQETKKMYISSINGANLRKNASKESDILTILSFNYEVVIESEENEWSKVKYQDYEGYISTDLLSETKTEITSRSSVRQETTSSIEENIVKEETVIKKVYVSVNVANIRAESNTNSAVVTKLKRKNAVDVIGIDGDFYKIKINDTVGYIANWIVTDKLEDIKDITPVLTTQIAVETPIEIPQATTETPTQTSSSVASQVAESAKQYLGYKYVYGGSSPSGFDCSGFVFYLYKQYGININRTATAQTKNGVTVSKDSLVPGDLVFFSRNGNGKIEHVGIYIGSGNFIHASNETRGVVTDNINSGYYKTNYMTARRIV